MKIYMRAWLGDGRGGRQGQLENLDPSWEGVENVSEKEDLTRLVRKKKAWVSTKEKSTLNREDKDTVEGSWGGSRLEDWK